FRSSATATADDVQEAAGRKLLNNGCHFSCALVVFTKGVGQAGVGVCGDKGVGQLRDFLDMRTQLGGTPCTVETDGDRFGMIQRIPEGFNGLAGQGSAAGIGNGAGNHDRQFEIQFLENVLNRKNRSLGVQCVKNGLDQDDVSAATDQAFGSHFIVSYQSIKIGITEAWIVDVRGERRCTAGRSNDTGNKARSG